MVTKRRLLILGPSFRRERSSELLPAIERYDGLFYRVARRYLDEAKDVDVVVMTDDLILVDGKTPLPYRKAEGNQWGMQEFPEKTLEGALEENTSFLQHKLKNKRFSEVFISMGKKYAQALPTMSQYGAEVVFPRSRGIGPKAQALKKWISARATTECEV